jgi:hypothetical protein
MPLPSQTFPQHEQAILEAIPFDPAKEGNPNIHWKMYYNFFVDKTEAYYKLMPGYIASDAYPEKKKSLPIVKESSDPKYVLPNLVSHHKPN